MSLLGQHDIPDCDTSALWGGVKDNAFGKGALPFSCIECMTC